MENYEVSVTIEETLSKTLTVYVPKDVDINDILEYAENKVREDYKNEKIVLTADDKYTTCIEASYTDYGITICNDWTRID